MVLFFLVQTVLKRLINRILFSIYGEDALITKEGWMILNDPEKRIKMRKWIENYHKTGEWDYSFWEVNNDITDEYVPKIPSIN